jgi:hypothetical protein
MADYPPRIGTRGDDEIIWGADDTRIFGLEGNDKIYPEGSPAHNPGVELDGGPGDDQVTGKSGNDLLFGGSGNDRLTGGTGEDRLQGGEGSDVFVIREPGGFETIEDFEPGQDIIEVVDFENIHSFRDIASNMFAEGNDIAINVSLGDFIDDHPTKPPDVVLVKNTQVLTPADFTFTPQPTPEGDLYPPSVPEPSGDDPDDPEGDPSETDDDPDDSEDPEDVALLGVSDITADDVVF